MQRILNSKYFKWGLTGFLTIAFGICFYYLIFMGKNISIAFNTLLKITMPIVDGLALAYIFTPILNWIESRLITPIMKHFHFNLTQAKTLKRIRSISIVLTLFFVLFIIYEFFAIIIPQLIRSIQSIIFQFPIYANNLVALVEKLLVANPDLENYVTNLLDTYSSDLNSYLNGSILPKVNTILKSVSTSILGILKAFYNLVIGFIISIYVLSNKEQFAGQAKKIAYALMNRTTANLTINNFRFINKTFIGFLGGKIIDSIIIGVICFAGTSIMGIPYATLVSVIVGITNIIPFFGPYIGAIPSTLLILMVDPIKSLYFLIFILILQQIDGNIIGPKILGDSTGLSGFWVIFSITFFGGLWGILGMVVGVPIFAVIYAGVTSVIDHILVQKDLPAATKEYLDLDYIDSDTDELIYREKNNISKDSLPNKSLQFSLVNLKRLEQQLKNQQLKNQQQTTNGEHSDSGCSNETISDEKQK